MQTFHLKIKKKFGSNIGRGLFSLELSSYYCCRCCCYNCTDSCEKTYRPYFFCGFEIPYNFIIFVR